MSETKLAIVTGASRGIGNAIATKLAHEGFAIVAVGTSALESVAANFTAIEQSGLPWLYVQTDVSTPEGREKIINAAMSRFGRIDVLVNNAGVAPKVRMDLLETTEESFDRVLGINLKSTFFLSQAAARLMCQARAKNPLLSPKIVNISSVSAYTSSTQRGEYCISKAASSMTTKLLGVRLADEGIGVYEIRPGFIETEMTAPVKAKYDAMFDSGSVPIRRWGTPADVASTVLCMAEGRLIYTVAQPVAIDGGLAIPHY